MTKQTAVVILAAGAGTRMRSSIPKPLHKIAGRPMIDYVASSALAIEPTLAAVVLSHDLYANDDVLTHLQILFGNRLALAIQPEPLGTGSALQAAIPLVTEAETVVVLFADHPLLTGEVLQELVATPPTTDAPVTLLTCPLEDAAGYGRIARDDQGNVRRIVERKDDDPSLRLGLTEVNSGMMAIHGPWLQENIGNLTASSTTGELYLTQLVEIATASGKIVNTVTGSAATLVGVNDRAELATAEQAILNAIIADHQRNGVSFVRPESSVIERSVTIGQDTIILPGCILRGATHIASHCVIGPNTVLSDSTIEAHCVVQASWITESSIGSHSDVGPYSHVRGGSVVGPAVHIGNFAELKNARLSDEVRVGHFSYLGDVSIGTRTNIGAGVVTCNYDGVDKHETTIGAAVFVGSDTMLVAPVELGDRSATGAGSVVTKDVRPGETVVGVPAKPFGPRREGK